jgi:hypothetical protein
LDFSRLRNGEIVAAVSGLALFIFMFFSWFGGGVEISTGGTQDVPGIGEIPNEPAPEETGVSAWDALQDFSGFLIALAAVSGITLGALAAAGQRINLPFQRGVGTLVLGKLAVLLILWRILANPGDLKIGIFLGLIAAAGIAIGAWIALREDGFEPLLKVPGGQTTEARTTVASATAPAATPTPRPSSAPGSSSSGGSRSSRSTAAKSRAGGSKSSAKKAPAKKKTTSSRSKSSSASRSKGGGSSRSKSSGSSRSKSGGSSRSKSSASSRSKSTGTRSRSKSGGSRARSKSTGTPSRSKSSGSRARSKSSGTRRRSSGRRK